MPSGRVRWFDANKGYGFIQTGEGTDDVFLPAAALPEGVKTLRKGAKVEYSGTPELMAKYAHLAIDAGARIVGGCCGTSVEHIRAMRAAIDGHTRGPRPTVDRIVDQIGPLTNAAPNNNEARPERARRRGRNRAAA